MGMDITCERNFAGYKQLFADGDHTDASHALFAEQLTRTFKVLVNDKSHLKGTETKKNTHGEKIIKKKPITRPYVATSFTSSSWLFKWR